MKSRIGLRMVFIFILIFVLALNAPAIRAASLSVGIDSDTSFYTIGENVILNVSDDPFSPVTITVFNSTNDVLFNSSSFQTNSSGKLTVQLNTSAYGAGSYRARVASGGDAVSKNFTVVSPYLSLNVGAVKPNGSAYAFPASVYYYFNGSSMNLMVNASSPNSHFSISVNLESLMLETATFDPAVNGTFSRGFFANGTAWYAFMVNKTIHANFTGVGLENIVVTGTTRALFVSSSVFKAAMNFQPSAMDASLAGTTTNWRAIPDFTNITGLTFEKFADGNKIASIAFPGQVNLCDGLTAASFLSLPTHMNMGFGRAYIDASALPAIDGNATIGMFNLSGFSMPGILRNGVPAVMAGQTSGGQVSALVWNGTLESLSFNVTALGLYVADGMPPFIVSTTPASNAYVNSSTLGISFRVNDSISGVSTSGASFQIENQTGIPLIGGSPSSGWVANFTAFSLVDGYHVVSLTVSDNVNNTATLSFHFTTDTAKPVFTSFLPVFDGFTNIDKPAIGANYTDLLSGIGSSSIYLDSADVTFGANFSEDGIRYTPFSYISEGIHTATVEVVDRAGNINSESWNFTVDLTPPIIKYVHPELNMIVPYNDSVYVNHDDNFGINLNLTRLWVDGVEVTNYSDMQSKTTLYWPVPLLAKGPHNATISIFDYANNYQSASWSFIVDNIPPTFSGFIPANGSTLTIRTVTIRVSTYDNLQVNEATMKIALDGRDVTGQATITKSGVTYYANLDWGQHRVDISVEDSSANVGSVVMLFTLSEPTGPSMAMIQDLIIMVVLIIVIIVVLVFLFTRGKKEVKAGKAAKKKWLWQK